MIWTSKNRALSSLLVCAVVAALVCSIVNLPVTLSDDDRSLGRYCGILLIFTITSVLFLGWSRRHGSFHIANLSTWLTVVVWLEFGLVPLICTFADLEDLDQTLVQAEGYVLIGMLAFWAAVIFSARRGKTATFVPAYVRRDQQRLYWGIGLLAIGTAAKFYLLSNGLFSYVADYEKVIESAPYLQWVLALSSFSFLSLIVLSIEALRPKSRLIFKAALGICVFLNLMFAVLSGMKEDLLFIPLTLCVISRLVNEKFPWKYATIGALLFVAMFPLNAYYRQTISKQGPVLSLGGGEVALAESVRTASEKKNEYIDDATESILYRLDLLSTLHFLIDDQGRSNLKGNEELWMLPIYSFVPRFLWHDKPVLNKGARLTYAMYSIDSSSTAVTPFGDFYIFAGISGILLGMIGVGLATQSISNLVTGAFDAKMIFIYVILFKVCCKPEWDMFGYVSLMVQQCLIALAMASLIYGGKLFSPSAAGRKMLEALASRTNLRLGAAREVGPLRSRPSSQPSLIAVADR